MGRILSRGPNRALNARSSFTVTGGYFRDCFRSDLAWILPVGVVSPDSGGRSDTEPTNTTIRTELPAVYNRKYDSAYVLVRGLQEARYHAA